ncbi:MAG: 2Fe-2S iron-sulfur cluster-binding protein [Ginsengibacter sp.]
MNSSCTIEKEPSSNMVSRAKDIHVKVLLGDEEYMLETYTNEYRNLMMLLYDKIYLEDFGECKGMGRCGTCVVEILESTNNISPTVRNEEATLKKTGFANTNIRLSCQIQVNDDLKNATIRIC